MTKLYFIRRTPSEIEIFGGTVYAEIDGKMVGEVGISDLIIDVEPGQHTIKMYKSHTYDTFIGFAEVNLNVEDGKDLTFRYSAPMTVTQAGHIVVADFTSIDDIDRQINQKENHLRTEKRENDLQEQKKETESQKNNKALILLVVVVPALIAAMSIFAGLIYFIAEMAYLGSIF